MSVCLFVWRFCDICLYSLNMGHRNWVLVLTEETKGAHFGTLKFELLPSQALPIFSFFFQKLQKRPGVVSGGKTRKSEQMDPFPQCKNVQKYIFLETRTIDLRQIGVTEHHFLNSPTQEPQGATLPCGCNLVLLM